VVEAVVTEPGVVSLRFSDGHGLDIPDSSERYESYTINLEGRRPTGGRALMPPLAFAVIAELVVRAR
jgi:hypothetical protein